MIEKTEQYVKNYLEDVESGHNWWHINRVRNTAMYIYSIESVGDPGIIEMAALLHDIGDHKIESGNVTVDLNNFLKSLMLDTMHAERITYIINNISFRDSFKHAYEHIPELDIVQDADRLDAIGAIGIARAFNYGGFKGFEIYNPEENPKDYKSSEEYIVSRSSTINHFYEKLLRLKDMMNTQTGKSLAEERHSYMEGFLKQFQREWNAGFYTPADMDL